MYTYVSLNTFSLLTSCVICDAAFKLQRRTLLLDASSWRFAQKIFCDINVLPSRHAKKCNAKDISVKHELCNFLRSILGI